MRSRRARLARSPELRCERFKFVDDPPPADGHDERCSSSKEGLLQTAFVLVYMAVREKGEKQPPTPGNSQGGRHEP